MGGKMQFYPVLALVMFGWPMHVFAGLQDARRVPNPPEPAEPPRREVALEHNVPVPNPPELAEPPHMSPIDSILPSTDPWGLWLSLFALCVAGVVCLGGASRLLSRNRKRAQASSQKSSQTSSQTSRNEQVVVPSMAPERPNDMPPDAARAHDVETLLNSMQARRALALSQGEKFVSAPAERQTSRPTLEAALVARIAAIGKRETEARKARENRTEPSQVTTD